ncbi:MAG: DUF861 domain-containing protein [Chloroflexi bacterium]|nr:DUF861 domain-containing protein [Chloroflexota bacterium]
MKLVVKKQAIEQDLEDTGVHPQALEDTAPSTAWLEVFSDDEGRDAGIWQCSPGKYRLERASDELCYILQGHWKLFGDNGDDYEVKAGDVLYLRKGWCGTSHVVETVRKVYMAC